MTIVACCQVDLDLDDPASTQQRVREAVQSAVDAGAELVILPELASCGTAFHDRAEAEERAVSVEADLERLRVLSDDHGIVLVAGFAEPGPYNSVVTIDRGTILARYRKTHLWDNENVVFVPGDQAPPVIDTSVGRIATMICYDAEFPELMRDVAVRGAQLVAVPANWPVLPLPARQVPMEVIRAQANASMNKVFVAVADRCGTERGFPFFGASLITDDLGFLIAGPGDGQPGVLIAEVDLTRADDKRISPHNDLLADRRTFN